jgi:hypothetical protein
MIDNISEQELQIVSSMNESVEMQNIKAEYIDYKAACRTEQVTRCK